MRDNWPVVLKYSDEGQGPFLVDLTHKAKWDLQDKNLAAQKPLGLDIPALPGDCTFQKGVLINRLNRTQCAIWHLLADAPALPGEPGYTDVTESTVFLALFGPNALAIAEKLTALDLMDPQKQTPFLLQGPFSHVPCQVVTLERGRGFDGGLLLTCSRGYAQSMVHAILDAGAEFGLARLENNASVPGLPACPKSRDQLRRRHNAFEMYPYLWPTQYSLLSPPLKKKYFWGGM